MPQQHPPQPNTEGLKLPPLPSTRPRPTKARNKFEAAVLKLPPSLKLPDAYFPTDAEIDAEIDALDAEIEAEERRSGKKLRSFEPYSREARRARYHKQWDEVFTRANRDTIQVWGLKPQNGDVVHTVAIPDSGLAVRLWDNGLDDLSQCCLDFIDSSSLRAVNSPEDWQLLPANKLGVIPAPLRSREDVAGYKKNAIPLGEERFDVLRARHYVIRRPNCPDFLFVVPMETMAGAAEPVESRAVA